MIAGVAHALCGSDAAAAFEDALRAAGEAVIRPCMTEFWAGTQQLRSEPRHRRYDGLETLDGGEIVLGFLGRCHMGDVVCVSGLVRRLKEQYRCRVHCVRHRATYAVLAENPYLDGFRNDPRVSLTDAVAGSGNMIQRLERFFDLPVSAFPRGELYLSEAELQWAWQFRGMLPRSRPLAVMSAGAITDFAAMPGDRARWQRWIELLSETHTVVQPAVTDLRCLEQVTRLPTGYANSWRPDHIYDNCIILENLPIRQFFALFAVAGLFLGTNTGSMHVAAAMGVPALVVLSRQKYGDAPVFPEPGQARGWRHQTFLYPYHSFLMV